MSIIFRNLLMFCFSLLITVVSQNVILLATAAVTCDPQNIIFNSQRDFIGFIANTTNANCTKLEFDAFGPLLMRK
eukprot:Pgem_evm1s14155